MAQLDIRIISKQFEKAIEQAVGKTLRGKRSLVKQTYKFIIGMSPIITGYYRSNHRIVIRDAKGRFKTQGARLSPGQKPPFSAPGSLDRVGETQAEEFSKLSKVALGDTVTIATIVPYAFGNDSVEQKYGVYRAAEGFISASA